MILDEPTNHLDIKKIFWLEDWLKECNITYVLVSHDREFLDKCTTKTVILDQDGCHYYNVPYSNSCEELIKEQAGAAREFEKNEKEIQRLQRSAEQLNRWANSKGMNPDLARRAKAMNSRADQIRLKQSAVNRETTRNITLHKEEIKPDVLMRIEDIWVKAPDNTPLFYIEKLHVRRGERIAILGKNGVGKTQFLNWLISTFQNTSLENTPRDIKINPQLRLGYMDQNLHDLPHKSRIDELITDMFRLSRTDCIRQLHNSGLPYESQNKRIEELSYGQKARLMLLALKLRRPNFYILDEPNNHLDITGRDQLEDILEHDEHTCIFVSHDRRMLRSVPNRFLHIINKKLVEDNSPDSYFELLQADT